ncbi:MAG: hypothetical protein JWN84_1138 [Nocardioides sp.]|nr:hypothetical protein [Nocardioides sp.]
MSITPATTAPHDATTDGQAPSPSRFRRGALHLAVVMPVGIVAALTLVAVWASTEWSVSSEGWGGLFFFIVAVYSVPVLLLIGVGAAMAVRGRGRGRRIGAILVVLAAAATSVATTWFLVVALPDASVADDALLAGVCALTVLPWLGFIRGVRRS